MTAWGRGALLAALAVGALFPLPAAGWADTARGRAIYERGQGGDPITARVGAGGIAAPATGFPCMGCHGVDGLGGREGGVAPPDITWDRLARADGPGGRGYDAAALVRAVRDGVAPDGRTLHPAMPRYTMAEADWTALVEHLKGLEAAAPGVSGSEIRVATLLPASGPLVQAGREVAVVLREAVRTINRRGGLHGRRLVLQTLTFDPALPGDALAVANRALRDEPPFCFLANLGLEADDPAVRALREGGVPDIAPLTAPLHRDEPWTVSLVPSVAEQAGALVRFAAGALEGKRRTLAVVVAGDERGQAVARAARAAARAHRITLVEVPAGAGWTAEAARLKAAGVPAILTFERPADVEAMLAAARAAAWSPMLLGPAERLQGTLPDEALAAAGGVFLAAPPALADPARALAFRRLVAWLGGTRDDLQRHAYGGALLLEEGVRRAGRRLSRDRLVEAIHGIAALDTGVVPARSFRPAQEPDDGAVTILRHERALRRYVPAHDPCADGAKGAPPLCNGYRQRS